MMRLMEQNYGKSLENYLSRFPVKVFESDDDFTWKLIGSARKNVPLYEAQDINGNVITSGMAGVNTEPFYVVFQEDYFADGEVIGGEKNEIYPLRILQDVIVQGTLYKYKVELMGGVLSGMPAEELMPGKRFSFDYAPVEKEFSRKVGDVRFASPISMRNEFSRIRIQHKVSGDKLDKKIAIAIPIKDDKTNKISNVVRWMHYADYQLEQQFSDYKNTALIYGTSNRTSNGEYHNFGKSGGILQTGAGIRELMSYANTYYYNDFSLRLLEDALFEISIGKIPMHKRVFVLETGERGAAMFSKAVQEKASGWQVFGYFGGNNAVNLIQNTKSEMHSNALSAGFQFTEYKAPMGVIIKVNVNPVYDDTTRNKIMHPEGGVAESYRFDLYDIGDVESPNIQIAKIKGREADIRGVVAGLRDPWNGVYGGQMSHDEDSATIHKYAELGAMVMDPNRTLSLIPAQLAA